MRRRLFLGFLALFPFLRLPAKRPYTPPKLTPLTNWAPDGFGDAMTLRVSGENRVLFGFRQIAPHTSVRIRYDRLACGWRIVGDENVRT